MFRFVEPSSGQFLKHSNITFSGRAHWDPVCLQSILTLKFKLNIVSQCIFEIYIKTPVSISLLKY